MIERNIIEIFGHYLDLNKLYDNYVIVDIGACQGELFKELFPYIEHINYKFFGLECCYKNYKYLINNNKDKNVIYYKNALVGQIMLVNLQIL